MNNHIDAIEAARKEINTLTTYIAPVNKKISALKEIIEKNEAAVEAIVKEANAELIERMDVAGADMICFDIENHNLKRDWFEDDGTLHIVVGKVRGCFPYKGKNAAIAKAKKFGVVTK